MVPLASFGLLALATAKTALLIIDVQDCFLEAQCTTSGQDGSLSVPGCDIIQKIEDMKARSCLFDEVIHTQDYHPAGHISYGSTHGLAAFSHIGNGGLPLTCLKPTGDALTTSEADAACCPTSFLYPDSVDCETHLCPPDGWDYAVNSPAIVTNNPACETCAGNPDDCINTTQMMWTDHCLDSGDSDLTIPAGDDDVVVQKGTNLFVDAYSAFMDNTKNVKTELDDMLQEKGITELYIVGIATDVCVLATVEDALGDRTGAYSVKVVSDATAAVLGDQGNYDAALQAMTDDGAELVMSADVLAMACPVVSGSEVSGSNPQVGSRLPGLAAAALAIRALA